MPATKEAPKTPTMEQRRLNPRTASAQQSIWHGLDEAAFRRHVVHLQKLSKEVPGLPRVHSLHEWEQKQALQHDQNRLLPLIVEQRLADDMAFVIAAEEGVKDVSAVAVEESINGDGLIIRVAVNDTIPKAVPDGLREALDLLETCARRRTFHLLFYVTAFSNL